ncbi:hypothetical protein L596_015692 [Steinernema carpocapsae]|uniref:Uncharacterized protein n=1 Tax=Steinernema carpocapsae TaxID=34508 RepID=A0A4U5NGT5_STECR|nr:hypothetical protein L596_015692 [Steinernema carpocapsae]
MAYRRRKPSISSSQKPAKLFRRVEEIIWRNKHFMLHLDTFIDPNLLQRMTHLLEMYISRTNGQSLKASLAKTPQSCRFGGRTDGQTQTDESIQVQRAYEKCEEVQARERCSWNSRGARLHNDEGR